jgi:hypothetical protein
MGHVRAAEKANKMLQRGRCLSFIEIYCIFTSFLSAVLRGTLHKYNSLLSFIAHGIVPWEMKNYYIYAKCPSKPLINKPKRNVSWVMRN